MKRDTLPNEYHYFLDESGDLSFFRKGKHLIPVGTSGVSSYYFLGMVKFNSDLTIIRNAVIDLQQVVDRDPYFKKIGSIEKKAPAARLLLPRHG